MLVCSRNHLLGHRVFFPRVPRPFPCSSWRDGNDSGYFRFEIRQRCGSFRGGRDMQSAGREEGDQGAAGDAGDDQMFPPGCRAEEPQRGSRHGALGEEAEGSHVRRRRRHRSVRDGRGKALGGSGVGISLRGGKPSFQLRLFLLSVYQIPP
ncbi:unnamed protein product [Musa acuminata var. zebrina]